MSFVTARRLYRNESAKSWIAPASPPVDQVLAFHKRLPGYQPTSLVLLPTIAQEVGVKAVHLKYEGDRLGLPSFKILGASWGTFRAVTKQYGLSADSDLEIVREALAVKPTTLFAATDGNHGRAVARMGTILHTRVEIYVPKGIHPSTVETIKSEGAEVTEVNGSYDEAVQFAFDTAEKFHGILVQDTAFPGYEEIPTVSRIHLLLLPSPLADSCRNQSGLFKATKLC